MPPNRLQHAPEGIVVIHRYKRSRILNAPSFVEAAIGTADRVIREAPDNDPARPPFARNCLLARRLVERGVQFVQLFHGDWDCHENPAGRLPSLCQQVDQGCAALILDLKKRGLPDETLLIWAGEFGRTSVAQKQQNGQTGRDHHIEAFPVWMAGGGVRPGYYIGRDG